MTHHGTDLGAYALGTLDPAERAVVAAHLAACPTCAAELSELAGLEPLLARLELADVEPPPAPEALYARTLAAVAAPTAAAAPDRARRRRWLAATAAAAVVLVAVVIGLRAGTRPDGPPRFSASAGPIRIAVQATAERSGTALTVRVVGLPENERCHLVAIADDGSRHAAGDWVATYDGDAQVTGATDVVRGDLRSLTLYGTSGQQLVSVALGGTGPG